MTKRLLLNSASSAFLYAVNIVIAFIMSPIIVRALGNRDYGIWEMLLSFCGYFGILELGFGPAIIRFVAREMAHGNRAALNRVFNCAFWGLLIAGSLSLIGMLLIAIAPEKLLNLKQGEVEGLSKLCVLAGFNLLVQFVGTLFVAFLMGRQEHFLVNTFRSVFYAGQAVFLFFALTSWQGSKLIWIAEITLVGNIFQYGVMCAIVLRQEKDLSVRRGTFSYETMKELYLFGIKSALLMVSDRIQRQSLPIIIGNSIGVSYVVFYAIPKRLVDYARDFVVSLGFPLMPYFSSIEALRIPGGRMKEWIPISRAVTFITLPAGLALLVMGEPFLNIWLGTDYGTKGRWVVIALAVSFLLTGMFSNSSRVLIAAGKHGPPAKKVLVISVLAIGAAIPASLWLGVTGAAVVVMAADLSASWVFWHAVTPHVGIGFSDHFNATIKPNLGPAVIMAGALIVGRTVFSPSGYGALLSTLLTCGSLYLLTAWRFALAPDERQAIRSKLVYFHFYPNT